MTIKNLNVKKGKVVIGNYSEVEILRVTSVSEVANLNLEPEHKNIIKKLIIIGTNPDLTGIETIGADDDELPNLESIELQNMAEVPEDLFNTYPYYNNWLKSFSAPEAEIIGERAFSNCAALLEINLPEATNIVGRNFYDCDALAEVYLPNAVTIGDFAFESCDVLRKLTLGGTNITIVSNAIYSIDTEEIDLYLSAGEMENVTNGNYWKY